MNRETTIAEVTRISRRFEKRYYPKVEKAIKGQISSLIDTIRSHGVNAGVREVNSIVTSPVAPVIKSMYLEVGMFYARRLWRDLIAQKGQKGFGFSAEWIKTIKDILFGFLTEKILFGVSITTREMLLTILNRSIAEGWGVDKTVKELEDTPLSKTQAARIVRTEITRATNVGQFAAAETFPFQQTKEWMSAHDMRTRGQHLKDHASHIGLDGQVIDYDQPFTDPINGDKIMYPGDPEASAASTINCRCTLGIVAKRDSNNRLIPK